MRQTKRWHNTRTRAGPTSWPPFVPDDTWLRTDVFPSSPPRPTHSLTGKRQRLYANKQRQRLSPVYGPGVAVVEPSTPHVAFNRCFLDFTA